MLGYCRYSDRLVPQFVFKASLVKYFLSNKGSALSSLSSCALGDQKCRIVPASRDSSLGWTTGQPSPVSGFPRPSRSLLTLEKGISWVFSDATSVEDVQVLDSWGSGDHYQRQVPSRIVYNPRLAWGYDIDPRELAYCWTKLLLDDHALSTEHDDSNLRKYYGAGFKTTPGGKTALDVVSDYLRLLYQHMMKELGRKLSEEILKITPIQFWFTLPALWSVRAQNATLQAASRSGFGSRPSDDIHLVKEPEAAAIASLSHLVAKGPSSQVEVRRPTARSKQLTSC